MRFGLEAKLVWTFRSRNSGDERPGSDWDILVVISDNALADIDTGPGGWRAQRAASLPVDLLTMRAGAFAASKMTVSTLGHATVSVSIRQNVSTQGHPLVRLFRAGAKQIRFVFPASLVEGFDPITAVDYAAPARTLPRRVSTTTSRAAHAA